MPASPFRILMLLDHAFPPDIRVENEALSLIEAGFEVGLLAIGPDDRPARETYRGIRLFRDKISAQARNKMRGLAGTVPLLSWYLARKIGHVDSIPKADLARLSEMRQQLLKTSEEA